MDSSTTSSSWFIYVLPLLAQPGGGSSSSSITSFWLPLAIVAAILAASAIAAWIFPGGPAWGSKILRFPTKNSLSRPMIPGPRGLPIVGSLLQMSGLAHRRLENLASKLNARRLMALSLGSTRLIVTSDHQVAREILGGAAFADRPLKQSAQQLLFGRAIGFAPYGDYWRRLRRIAAGCLFSPRRIAAHEELRQKDTNEMCDEIFRSANNLVQVRGLLQKASLSSIMGSVFGRKFEGDEEMELQAMVREGFELLGAFNFADHLPSLREFDPQGVVQRCAALVPRVNAFVQKIIDEHRAEKSISTTKNIVPGDHGDFVDVLLGLQGEDKLDDSDIIAVLWEMIFRGTDTTAILTEWCLAELVLNPEIQRKLQDEIDSVSGDAVVRDGDVENMPFLQAVVNETLRMHPPGPLLSWARLATQDVDVAGYHVPAGTTAMVNMWAITHDDAVWSDPFKFKPQRFMEGEFSHFDVRGSDLRLAPFGAGRRVCPGRALGLATVRLWVARLVQEFTWQEGCDGVDLSELLKLSCEMANPLKAKAIPRRSLLA